MHQTLFLRYLKWHFVDAARDILQGWGNILWFNLNYFSVLELSRTFFSPWKGIRWQRERGFAFGDFLFILASNLISRTLGAIMRTFLIAAGLGGEMFLLGAGFFVFVFWLSLPLLILLGFWYGIVLLF